MVTVPESPLLLSAFTYDSRHPTTHCIPRIVSLSPTRISRLRHWFLRLLPCLVVVRCSASVSFFLSPFLSLSLAPAWCLSRALSMGSLLYLRHLHDPLAVQLPFPPPPLFTPAPSCLFTRIFLVVLGCSVRDLMETAPLFLVDSMILIIGFSSFRSLAFMS